MLAIDTIHNLAVDDCRQVLREIQRVCRKDAFVFVDAWCSEAERERLMKWNLTALTCMQIDEWKKPFEEVGYSGDYWWFIAE